MRTLQILALWFAAGQIAFFDTTQASAIEVKARSALEFRQFDFWVGKWDVYRTGKDKMVSHSLIESVYGGCGIRENWMPLKADSAGGSLSIYVPADHAWRQTWIDAGGSHVEFKGGWNGNAMVLTGFWKDVLGPGKDATIRMTYTKRADGSVRQLGEATKDGGKSWATNFDFTYRPTTP